MITLLLTSIKGAMITYFFNHNPYGENPPYPCFLLNLFGKKLEPNFLERCIIF